MDVYRRTMVALGLRNPIPRGIAVAAAVAVALYIYKPAMFFVGSQPRPWSLTDSGPSSTLVPAWMVPTVAGVLASGFI